MEYKETVLDVVVTAKDRCVHSGVVYSCRVVSCHVISCHPCRFASGRVVAGREVLEISRIGSDMSCVIVLCRVGSGRVRSGPVGSGRVRSGQFGSGRVVLSITTGITTGIAHPEPIFR